MGFVEAFILLFIVVDPFGNIPFVVALLRGLGDRDYRRVILRETTIAFVILALFLIYGDAILDLLRIRESSLSIAGGIILFLIAVRMIFRGSSHIFDHEYSDDPVLVPIAVPAIAGPSAITAAMILQTGGEIAPTSAMTALVVLYLATLLIFFAGRLLAARLGPKGLYAVEKFMGMLLSLVAVDMALRGVEQWLG